MLTIAIIRYDPTLESAHRTKRCIDSLQTFQPRPYELIIIDNDSPVQSSVPEWARLLTLPKNIGFGKAVNLAYEFKDPRSDFFAQVNPDCIFLEDTFSALRLAMERHGLDVAYPEHFEGCQHYALGKTEEPMGPEWRFGACWLGLSSAFDRVIREDGFLFDPRFFLYYEDTDLWRRMESKGMKLAGYRGTWVSHLGGGSGSSETTPKLFDQSRKLYEEKWNATASA